MFYLRLTHDEECLLYEKWSLLVVNVLDHTNRKDIEGLGTVIKVKGWDFGSQCTSSMNSIMTFSWYKIGYWMTLWTILTSKYNSFMRTKMSSVSNYMLYDIKHEVWGTDADELFDPGAFVKWLLLSGTLILVCSRNDVSINHLDLVSWFLLKPWPWWSW